HLAMLRGAELTLHTIDPLAVVGRITIPGPVAEDPHLVFVNRQVLVHGQVGEHTHLTLLHVPKLTLVSQLELETNTRLLAATHGSALLDRGGSGVVVTCTPTATAVAPLRVEVAIERAVGLENPEFLTWSARGTEVWAAVERRPTARLDLVLPEDITAIGLAGQQRHVWVTTARRDLQACRLSDGRTIPISLPGTPMDVTSHPVSSWLVADLDGAPHAINIAL